mmetsp:Transcript_6531/g.16130  ORF Transcript_6531/g.16130 Transcript_6531/m.16130 type:complete len:232 (-) Transcript_6531:298-993(-)
MPSRRQPAEDVAVAHGGKPDALGAEQLEQPRHAHRVDGRRRLAAEEGLEEGEDVLQRVDRAVPRVEVEIAVVRDEALVTDRALLIHAGRATPPGDDLLRRRPGVRVAAEQVCDGRGGEARVPLEERGRLDRTRGQVALEPGHQQIAQVCALAIDHTLAHAAAACTAALVGDESRALRAAHHGDAQHGGEKLLHLGRGQLVEEHQPEVAAEEGLARPPHKRIGSHCLDCHQP